MDIQIQDQHPLHKALLQEDPRSDGQVIDDAEARACVREGMVRASGCVAGQLVLQGQPRRQQRPCNTPGIHLITRVSTLTAKHAEAL